MTQQFTRRAFSAIAAGAAGTALAGPNAGVRLGFIGVGNRGSQLLAAFKTWPDADIRVLCDLYRPHLEKAAALVGGNLEKETDFRKVLDRKDLDAVVIATPDHWHALQTIAACKSGKDVYCEKPLSMTIVEGRAMVKAARETGRIVQVGLHRRSSPAFQKLAETVRGGALGKVTVGRAYRLSNMSPAGIGSDPDGSPPPDLDWEMWLGPRAARPFNPTIAPYKFRWWQAYSSQIANWGVHYFDALRWAWGVDAPASLCAIGGKYAVKDNRDVPDTAECVFELPGGGLLVFGQYEASGAPMFKTGEMEMRGTTGVLYASESMFEITPETGGQFQDRKPRAKPRKETFKSKQPDATELHARNFLDCIKSRVKPNCDVEEGHRSTIFAHLANISLATRERLDWDPAAERFTNSAAANKLLHYEYRAPWKLEG